MNDWTAGLTTQQAAAFQELRPFMLGKTEHAMAVLRGFAGTGKTFLVSRLIKSLAGTGLRIAVAAPTNKAVRVLRDKMVAESVFMGNAPIEPDDYGTLVLDRDRVAFGSIHSLLGLKLTDREDGLQECKESGSPTLHQYHVVVVDECSMVGADLFMRIVAAKRQARILFVGDPAQLPPIEAIEQISPTFEKVALQTILSDVVRQARENPIIQLSIQLRQAIESGQRIDPASISATLPPLHEHPAAALVAGGAQTVIHFTTLEIKAGRDARALAFTNQVVLAYNQAIHESLYGMTEYPFVPGEPVIAQMQCDVHQCDADGGSLGLKTNLITSEEATVVKIESGRHPYYPTIDAYRVVLARDDGKHVLAYLPADSSAHQQAINDLFAEWRRLRALQEDAKRQNRSALALTYREDAKAASGRAWMLRKAFAPLRHAYALTAHKSQGSTFDTAIVDLNDMARMKSAFQFNRGLYVATTRPRHYLAIVV